jgi:hypothetical protein
MFARLCLLSILSIGAFAAPAVSKDNGLPVWGKVGSWQIGIDPGFGNGCFATQYYEDGTGIRLGIDAKRQSVYLLLANPAWKSLQAGQAYPVRFVFDDTKTFDTELAAGPWAGMVVLGRSDMSGEFVADFVQRTGLRVYYRGAPIAQLLLRDAYDAVTEMARCQQEVRSADSGAPAVRPASDPFSR